jgi:threonine aldolase
MAKQKVSLASDNYAPVHPLIMEAIAAANAGWAPAYGSDEWTAQVEKLLQHTFGPCKVLMTTTGTGANVLALKASCRRHESVLCSSVAHVAHQEAGAAESLVGCKLLPIPHILGKLTPENVLKKLHQERFSEHHATLPRVLSITQSTELGTVYTLDELKTLASLCKKEKLLLHMDGSRIYNAAIHLKTSLHDMAQHLDLLSLGGTKNGCMSAESLLIFNPALHDGCDYLQKQTLQLLSKMRYSSAQYLPFFEKQLWHQLALHANQMALKIASIVQKIPHVRLNYPVETNQLFLSLPPAWIPLIQKQIECYLWDEPIHEIRFVTSWDTSEKDVETVRSVFQDLARS